MISWIIFFKSLEPIFQKMGPFVINLENLSKTRAKAPEIRQNLDFSFLRLRSLSWLADIEIDLQKTKA